MFNVVNIFQHRKTLSLITRHDPDQDSENVKSFGSVYMRTPHANATLFMKGSFQNKHLSFARLSIIRVQVEEDRREATESSTPFSKNRKLWLKET